MEEGIDVKEKVGAARGPGMGGGDWVAQPGKLYFSFGALLLFFLSGGFGEKEIGEPRYGGTPPVGDRIGYTCNTIASCPYRKETAELLLYVLRASLHVAG